MKKEAGRRKKEEGRRKKEEGSRKKLSSAFKGLRPSGTDSHGDEFEDEDDRQRQSNMPWRFLILTHPSMNPSFIYPSIPFFHPGKEREQPATCGKSIY